MDDPTTPDTGSGEPAAQPPHAPGEWRWHPAGEKESNGMPWWASLYFYAVAAVGTVMLLTGAVMMLQGTARAAAPGVWADAQASWQRDDICRSHVYDVVEPVHDYGCDPEDEARSRERSRGVRDTVTGVSLMVVGGPVGLWHLRQVRRKEDAG